MLTGMELFLSLIPAAQVRIKGSIKYVFWNNFFLKNKRNIFGGFMGGRLTKWIFWTNKINRPFINL